MHRAPGSFFGGVVLFHQIRKLPGGDQRRAAPLRNNGPGDAAGVDLSRPLITSCGSGVTANVLIFAAHLIGKHDVALYDGSWSEWGADPETPKETGAAR